MAEGRRAVLDLIPYSTSTTSTHLYLWPLFLGILGMLGVPLTLATAHVLSGLAYVWLAFVGWYIMARQLGWWLAGLFVLPTTLYLFVAGGDLLSLGTELLPVAILMTAALVLFSRDTPITATRLGVVAFGAGLSVWAKPQLFLLAVTLLIIALLMPSISLQDQGTTRANRPWYRSNLVVGVAGFWLPTVISVLVMLSAGTFGRFLRESVDWQLAYVGARSTASNGSSPPLIDRLQAVSTFLYQYPLAYVWAVAGLVGWQSVRFSRRSHSPRWRAALIWLLPMIAATLTLLGAFPLYPHYANIVFAATMMSGMAGTTISRRMGVSYVDVRKSRFSTTLALGAAALVIVALWIPPVARNSSIAPSRIATDGAQFARLCPRGSQVLVWGWSAELYSYFDWEPASRYVDNTWQLLQSPQRPYYKATLVDELRKNPPKCILEPFGTQFFAGLSFPPITTIVPSTSQLLRACYHKAPPSTAMLKSVTVYVRTAACTAGSPGGT